MDFNNLNCGNTARDIITGFSGTITGMAVYIAGRRQICLSPNVNRDGKPIEPLWFDIDRIAITTSLAEGALSR